MKVMPSVNISAALIITICLMGCGGGNNNSNANNNGSNNNSSNGSLIGVRLGAGVYMQPGPPAYTFPPWSGSTSDIRIDEVVQFSSNVNPAGTNINQPTTQVVFGQITGPTSGVEVVVYSFTNAYYIQPLTSTTINISSNSTWIAPANPGQISALLIRQGYSVPDTTATLPAVDNVNVFAVATQP